MDRRQSDMGRRGCSGMQVQLDRSTSEPLYGQIYRQIRGLITSGALVKGDRLPSIRSLVDDLGISHITVERAYQQLVAEGYVESLARAGFVVNEIDTSYFDHPEPDHSHERERVEQIRRRSPFVIDSLRARNAEFDFSFTSFAPGSFPAKEWSSLTSRTLAQEPDLMDSYAAGRGQSLLAQQVSRHVGITRGVRCSPDQVIVRAGTRDALLTVLLLLGDRITSVAHENPGYDGLTDLLRTMSIPIEPLPVLEGWEAYINTLHGLKSRLVFCTPSHQFPTGGVMPVSVRVELLKWASDNNAYIIEDDACQEYRYHVPPIPSLFSLDRCERVIYLGGFSKSLSPALRVAYMVLPWHLLERYWDREIYVPSSVSLLTQETLGRFMESGSYGQHTSRLVSSLQTRHDILVRSIRETFGDMPVLLGVNAGMHLYAIVNNGMSTRELIDSAYDQGAKVYDPKVYWHSSPAPRGHVIIGFSSIDPDVIPAGVKALGRAWL